MGSTQVTQDLGQFVTRDLNLAAAAIASGGQLVHTAPPNPGTSRLTFTISGVSPAFDQLVAQGSITVNAREMCAALYSLVGIVQSMKRSRA